MHGLLTEMAPYVSYLVWLRNFGLKGNFKLN